MIFACDDKEKSVPKITIATAANMHFTMSELVKIFTQKTGIQCDLVINSSGKLTAQIQQGAPYDVFVAADMKYPNEIFNQGRSYAPPKVYAYGKLVLWSMIDNVQPSVALLTAKNIKHIAIANPKTAPYGIAAIDALKHHQKLKSIEHKLVYGESIGQVNQFINSKSVTVGFTALSVVLSSNIKGKGHWTAIDTTAYNPIQQGVILIKQKKENTTHAEKFYNFLFSNEAKSILEKFGYLVK